MNARQGLFDLLKALLLRNGISKPSGRPLYALQCTDDEFTSLQDSLIAVMEKRSLTNDEEYAAFCLVGAEWIRREHAEGPITWRSILVEGMGVPTSLVDEHEKRVRDYTKMGMKWWKRILVSLPSSTRYQATLACEGGLPLRLLHNDQWAMTRYFRSVLREHERYPNESLSVLAEQYACVLRQSLRNEIVLTLTVELVAAIAKLRKKLLRLPGAISGPLASLDKGLPNWRSSLPLRLDDKIAEDLLRGLLNETAVGLVVADKLPSLRTVIERAGGHYLVKRYLHIPPELPQGSMTALFATREEFPPRLLLSLQSGTSRTAVAKASLLHGQQSYRIDVHSGANLSRAAAERRVQLVATVGDQEFAKVDIAGGEALPDGLWIFEDLGSGAPGDYLGNGSVRTQHPSLLVADGPHGPEFVGDQPKIEKLGEISGSERFLFRVLGDGTIAQDGAMVRLRTRTPPDVVSYFEMRGQRSQLGPGGTEVWLGVPEIWELPASGGEQTLPHSQIQWRSVKHSSAWRVIDTDCLGEVQLRIVRKGEVVWRQSMTVFGSGFALRLMGGPTRNEGRIEFINSAARSITVEADDQYQTNVTPEGERFTVEVHRLRGSAPTMQLRLQFGVDTSAKVRVTCPVPFIAVIDAGGRACNLEAPIPIELLPGLQIQAVLPNGITPLVRGPKNCRLAWLRRIEEESHVYELPMFLLRDRLAGLLATSEDPHRAIDLTLCSNRQRGSVEARIRICRHAGQAEFPRLSDPDFVAVNVPDQVLTQPWCDLDNACLEVVAIGHSDIVAPLDAVDTAGPGRWDLDLRKCGRRTWLATVWLGSGACLHPFSVFGRLPPLLNGKEENGVSPTSGAFDQAMEVCNPNARLVAWRRVVKDLGSHPNHSGWERMDEMLRQVTRKPVTTFDAVLALVSNPSAVALAGLRHAQSQIIWDRLQELPFLWATIGVKTWAQAWSLHWQQQLRAVDEMIGVDSAIQDDIRRSFDQRQRELLVQLQLRVPGMACIQACLQVVEDLAELGPGGIERLLPNAVLMIKQTICDLRTRITAGHEDDEWPVPRLFVPDDAQHYVRQLGLWECTGYQRAVLQAPVLAAWHSAMDVEVNEGLMRDLHEVRGFESDWFDRVHEQAMFLIAGSRLRRDPRCYRPSMLGVPSTHE